jgi:hypothetical protein
MRRLEDIKKELKGLAANRLEDALLRLKELLPAGSELCREVALQQSRLNQVERDFLQGIAGYYDRTVAYNRACMAILTLIDGLKPEDLAVDTHSIFDLRIPRYKPDLMRLNRRQAKSRFSEKFERLKTADTQHYIILAERHQQPRTFVERLILDLEDRGFSLDYEPEGDYHVRLAHLDPGSDLEGAQLFFRQYLSQRFHQDISRLADLKPGFPPSGQYEYIITAFEFAGLWEKHTGELLRWIATDFSQPPPSLPTHFIFFYIIDEGLLKPPPAAGLLDFLSGRKSTRQLIQQALQHLETLPNCTLIPELQPVPVEELAAWLHDYVSNEEEIDKLLQEVLRPLGDGQDQKRLNMSFIERRLMEYIS